MGTLTPTLKLAGNFLLHIIVGVVIFVALAGAAFGIWEFTEWMRELNAPYWLLVISDAVAYLLFAIDTICASFFAAVEGMKFLCAVWRAWRLEALDGRE